MKTNIKQNPDLLPILLEGLNTQIVQITFNKKNGDVRVMNCTKSPEFIPDDLLPRPKEGVKNVVVAPDEEPTFTRVFDTDIKEWRTVIHDSVTKFGNP